MNIDFIENLSEICNGKTAFLGIGNIDRGDDGAGIALAGLLTGAGLENVYDGGVTPEKVIPIIRDGGFDSVVFMDAVDMSSEPGSISIIDTQELVRIFPPISTHKLSLGALAMLVTDGNNSRVWLIGIQPGATRMETSGGRIFSPRPKSLKAISDGFNKTPDSPYMLSLSKKVAAAVLTVSREITVVMVKERICI
jgi:hydrogenase maturation protease